MKLLLSLRSVAKELIAIRRELSRIADALERDLMDKGLAPMQAVKEESSVDYVDEEIDWGRENIPNFDILLKRAEEQK